MLRNLWNHYVFGSHTREGSFWSGLAAVRRDVFFLAGQFDTNMTNMGMVDAEFGDRLSKAHAKTCYTPILYGEHLKRWTFKNWIRSDFFDRGLPWAKLFWRTRVKNTVPVRRTLDGMRFLLSLAFYLSLLVSVIVGRQYWIGALVCVMITGVPFAMFVFKNQGAIMSILSIPFITVRYLSLALSVLLAPMVMLVEKLPNPAKSLSLKE